MLLVGSLGAEASSASWWASLRTIPCPLVVMMLLRRHGVLTMSLLTSSKAIRMELALNLDLRCPPLLVLLAMLSMARMTKVCRLYRRCLRTRVYRYCELRAHLPSLGLIGTPFAAAPWFRLAVNGWGRIVFPFRLMRRLTIWPSVC